jgi:hypothetical protein
VHVDAWEYPTLDFRICLCRRSMQSSLVSVGVRLAQPRVSFAKTEGATVLDSAYCDSRDADDASRVRDALASKQWSLEKEGVISS